jgi:hypothetical protein
MLDPVIREEIAGLRADLDAILAGLDRPRPVRVLCILYARLTDMRADLRSEFPRFFEARRPEGGR